MLEATSGDVERFESQTCELKIYEVVRLNFSPHDYSLPGQRAGGVQVANRNGQRI
jgi:hypothetical protein